MYKAASRGLRLATGVHRIVGPADQTVFQPAPPDMGHSALASEREQLLQRITGLEGDIARAKRAGRLDSAAELGRRKGCVERRLATVNAALKQRRQVSRDDHWRAAIVELAPDQVEAIEARFRLLVES